MSSAEFFSPDPAEVMRCDDIQNGGECPNTLAPGEVPEPGVSYTPRITRPREVYGDDDTDHTNVTAQLIGVLPAPVPPTPQRLIRS